MGGSGTRSDILAKLEFIQSDRLLETAVERLGLTNESELNKSLLGRWTDELTSWTVVRSISNLGRSAAPEIGKLSNSRIGDLHMVADMLKASLDIEPQKAAHIVNTFVDLYIADKIKRRVRASA